MMKEFFITDIPRGELVDSVRGFRCIVLCILMFVFIIMYVLKTTFSL